MEQHPVPQNVTTFQFKLIGDITLKQFAYVAGGIILAYIFFKLGILPALVRYPLAIFTAMLGFGLAFIPIEQRPMDRWLSAFIKSIYMPTQFLWQKSNPVPEALETSTLTAVQTVPVIPQQAIPSVPVVKPPPPITPPHVVQVQPAPMPPPPQYKPNSTGPGISFTQSSAAAIKPNPLPFKPVVPKQNTNNWAVGAPPIISKTTFRVSPASTMTPVTGKHVEFKPPAPVTPVSTANPQQVEKLKNDYQVLEKRLTEQMQIMQQEMQKGTVTNERFMELQQLLTQLLTEKDRMSHELTTLRQQLEHKSKSETVKPTEYKTLPDVNTSVKIVPPSIAMRVGVPQLTTYPNVVTGIVKDSQGNLLPNIILTVKDREGMPVRALKTNKIGQFAASTPLTNGTYIIELEDPKKAYTFDRFEVTLSNQVLPPLEISAVSQKDVMRQKLAQEIFGRNKI